MLAPRGPCGSVSSETCPGRRTADLALPDDAATNGSHLSDHIESSAASIRCSDFICNFHDCGTRAPGSHSFSIEHGNGVHAEVSVDLARHARVLNGNETSWECCGILDNFAGFFVLFGRSTRDLLRKPVAFRLKPDHHRSVS